MSAALVHRGPDSAGAFVRGSVGLAMRRLAIIDVAGGQQPLHSEDGQVHLVCNGEIYNFRELRAELELLGHRFRTNSDCETIVHAYEAFGLDFVDHLNGMFAFALWDERRQRLVLGRDRVGIKPLYYAEHEGKLLFASELKALLAYPGFPRTLDLGALSEFLTYHYVPTPRSIFAGVRKLRPGHLLIVEGGRSVEQRYWEPDFLPDPELLGRSEQDLANLLWETLRDCVDRERVSDVPLGVFLSGGIDSSALVAAMAELQPAETIQTFSIGFADRSFDESEYARLVARSLGTTHRELILEPRMLPDLVPSVASFLDEPFSDASILPTHLLSRFTREHVTVALGGDGGDELFAGYSTLQAHRIAAFYRRLPPWIRQRVVTPIVERLPVSYSNLSLDFKAKRFISSIDHSIGERHHRWIGAYAPEEKRRVLQREVLATLNGERPYAALDEHLARCTNYDELTQILYLDMKMYLEGDILPKVDRASMACSLEVRVPFLNSELVEMATRLPISLKLRGLTRKYLLRRAVRGRLPNAIIDRPKKGFGIPVSRWLQAELRELMLDLLAEDRLRRQGLFEPAHVHRLIAEHLASRRDHRMLLWPLLIFQLWHQRFLESGRLEVELRDVLSHA